MKPSISVPATPAAVRHPAPVVPKTEPVSESPVKMPMPQTDKIATESVSVTSTNLTDIPAAAATVPAASEKKLKEAPYLQSNEVKISDKASSVVEKDSSSTQAGASTTVASVSSASGQAVRDPISSESSKTASESGEKNKNKTSETPIEVTASEGAEVTDKLPVVSVPAEKVLEKSEECSETVVSAEHSYVRTSESEEKGTAEDQGKIAPPVSVSRSISVSSDGMIHGVGMTPPPEGSESISATSLEDGVLVSNVVIIGKVMEKKAEDQQQNEEEKSKKSPKPNIASAPDSTVALSSQAIETPKVSDEKATEAKVKDENTVNNESSVPAAETKVDKEAKQTKSNSQSDKDCESNVTSKETDSPDKPVDDAAASTLPPATVSSDSSSVTAQDPIVTLPAVTSVSESPQAVSTVDVLQNIFPETSISSTASTTFGSNLAVSVPDSLTSSVVMTSQLVTSTVAMDITSSNELMTSVPGQVVAPIPDPGQDVMHPSTRGPGKFILIM